MGHKNPDNDAISAAVGYAWLKNEIAHRDGLDETYEPIRLGPLPAETAYIFEKYGIEVPRALSNVCVRVRDVMTGNPISIAHDAPLIEAGRSLRKHNVRSLVVTNDDGSYAGLITTRMIAERYISSTDVLGDAPATDADYRAVTADLAKSLFEKVDDALETDVLVLDAEGLLDEAVEDLMASALREAVVLDESGNCIGIVTRSDVAARPRFKVILVDHNETRQAAAGIEEVEIVEIVDHHRIGDVSTALPIRFINMPVGSSSAIVTSLARNEGIEVPKPIAAALLSACLTDTVILKSPTTTAFDHDQVAYLSNILGVDPVEFGIEVFRCRGGEADMPVEKLVGADAKEFQLGDSIVLIAQHETVALQGVLAREGEIRAHLAKLVSDHGYEFALLMVTDIIAEGSQFISEGDRRVVERAFDISCKDGSTWMPGVLSRKKQVAARILGA